MTSILPSVLRTPNDCNTLSEQDEKEYDKRKGVGCEFITSCSLSIADVSFEVGAWSSKFTYQCLLPVTIAVLDTNPPDYKHILRLDEQIRAFPIPSSAPNDSDDSDDSDDSSYPLMMQHFIFSHYREHGESSQYL